MHTHMYMYVYTLNPLFSENVCGKYYINSSELNFHAQNINMWMNNYHCIRHVDRAVVVGLELLAMSDFICWCLQILV